MGKKQQPSVSRSEKPLIPVSRPARPAPQPTRQPTFKTPMIERRPPRVPGR